MLAGPQIIDIERAARLLAAGGVVTMPTETVYGLACDARDPHAVAQVFRLKGRPATNPLIVHVHTIEAVWEIAQHDARAERLLRRFAPGPLSVVLRHRAGVCEAVRAGGATVAVRIPRHRVALELLRAFDGPVAAPSANRSNHVSPTTPAHVFAEFGAAVPIVDGGACDVGIESTVIDVSDPARATILRPGLIGAEELEREIGPCEWSQRVIDPSAPTVSPGMHARHYAPRAPARLVDRAELDRARPHDVARTALLLARDDHPIARHAHATRVLDADASGAARHFYALLRELDATGPAEIWIEAVDETGAAWEALRDRMRRATGFHPGSDRA